MVAEKLPVDYNGGNDISLSSTGKEPIMNSYSVSVKKIVEDFHLTIVHASSDFDTVQVMVEEVSRPGLQRSGFFNHC